jgi:hypothetical protein
VGHAQHSDGVLIEGDPHEGDFEAVYVRNGVPIGGLAVNRPRAIPALRKRIERGHWPPRAGEVEEEVA